MERFIEKEANKVKSNSVFKIQYGEIYSFAKLFLNPIHIPFKIQYGEIYSLSSMLPNLSLQDLKSSMERFIVFIIQTPFQLS